MRFAPRTVDIPAAGGGRLEGLLQTPEPPRSPRFAAVVCHPHPMHGGTMHNSVAYRLARSLEEAGGAVLRFNFRGVGASTGAFDQGIGEREDVRAALDYLARLYPGLPLWVGGFSFGSWVGLWVGARDERVKALFGVGLPLSLESFGFLSDCRKPMAFVQAEHDEFGSAPQLRALVENLPGHRELWIVGGASHLFPGRMPALETALGQAARWLADASLAPGV